MWKAERERIWEQVEKRIKKVKGINRTQKKKNKAKNRQIKNHHTPTEECKPPLTNEATTVAIPNTIVKEPNEDKQRVTELAHLGTTENEPSYYDTIDLDTADTKLTDAPTMVTEPNIEPEFIKRAILDTMVAEPDVAKKTVAGSNIPKMSEVESSSTVTSTGESTTADIQTVEATIMNTAKYEGPDVIFLDDPFVVTTTAKSTVISMLECENNVNDTLIDPLAVLAESDPATQTDVATNIYDHVPNIPPHPTPNQKNIVYTRDLNV